MKRYINNADENEFLHVRVFIYAVVILVFQKKSRSIVCLYQAGVYSKQMIYVYFQENRVSSCREFREFGQVQEYLSADNNYV